MRAAELGIDIVRQTAEDKLPACTADSAAEAGCSTCVRFAFIGDDLPDLAGDAAGWIGRGGGRRVHEARAAWRSMSPRAAAAAERCAKRSSGF